MNWSVVIATEPYYIEADLPFKEREDDSLMLCAVTEAAAEILGAPDLHIKSGSTLRLVCTLRQSTEPPVFVFWYHEHRMINYDQERGVDVHSDRSSSVLVVAEAQKTDSGNYSCVPSNARPASINVHVLNGKTPSRLQPVKVN